MQNAKSAIAHVDTDEPQSRPRRRSGADGCRRCGTSRTTALHHATTALRPTSHLPADGAGGCQFVSSIRSPEAPVRRTGTYSSNGEVDVCSRGPNLTASTFSDRPRWRCFIAALTFVVWDRRLRPALRLQKGKSKAVMRVIVDTPIRSLALRRRAADISRSETTLSEELAELIRT